MSLFARVSVLSMRGGSALVFVVPGGCVTRSKPAGGGGMRVKVPPGGAGFFMSVEEGGRVVSRILGLCVSKGGGGRLAFTGPAPCEP